MMSKVNRARHKILETHYKKFYKSNKCYYCGDLADTMDHIPAVSIVYSFGVDYFTNLSIPLYKVSCCNECNVLLGSKEINTLKERVVFIYDKLQYRYRRFLAQVSWYEDELEELDGHLRTYIENSILIKNFIENRLVYMEEIHYDYL